MDTKKIVIEVKGAENGGIERIVRVYRNGKKIKTIVSTRILINHEKEGRT